jgi:hypothetical protein
MEKRYKKEQKIIESLKELELERRERFSQLEVKRKEVRSRALQ